MYAVPLELKEFTVSVYDELVTLLGEDETLNYLAEQAELNDTIAVQIMKLLPAILPNADKYAVRDTIDVHVRDKERKKERKREYDKEYRFKRRGNREPKPRKTPEELKAYQKAYRDKNRDKQKAYQLEYKKTRREKAREYAQQYREKKKVGELPT